jgi:hypothetical protein
VAGKACVLQVAVLSILVSFEQQNGLRLTWFYDSENQFLWGIIRYLRNLKSLRLYQATVSINLAGHNFNVVREVETGVFSGIS